MAALKLYHYPLAFNPQKAKLAFVEKGVPHQVVPMDIFRGQSLQPAYLKINPAGSVPSLELPDGSYIAESKKILEYVDCQGGEPLGGTEVNRTTVQEWLDRVDAWDGNLFMAANADQGTKKLLGGLGAFRQKVAEARMKENPGMKDVYEAKIASMKAQAAEGEDKAAIAKNRSQLEDLLNLAQENLSKTKFLAGDAYSMADVIFTPVLYRIHSCKLQGELLDPRPAVKAYYEVLKARPSFNVVFGPAGSGFTTAKLVVPALAKMQWAKLTGRY